MANADNPNGFKPYSASPRVTAYTATDTITAGDLLKMHTDGKLKVHDNADAVAVGVAATSAGANETVYVYDDPTTIFIGQCSGTYQDSDEGGALVDVEGTTGQQEVDENGTTRKILRILRQEFVPGSMESHSGNERVLFTISEHMLGSLHS